MILVVDASVAVKWFMAEPDSGLARRARAAASLLLAPELVLAEVLNATWTAARRGQFTAVQLAAVAQSLPRHFDELVPARDLLARTAAIADALAHPVYDCFYLALAETRSAPLVTADGRLTRRAAGSPWASIVQPLAGFAPGAPP